MSDKNAVNPISKDACASSSSEIMGQLFDEQAKEEQLSQSDPSSLATEERLDTSKSHSVQLDANSEDAVLQQELAKFSMDELIQQFIIEKKKAQKNQDEWMGQLEEEKKKAALHWEQAMRWQADLDNAMKRTELAVQKAHKFVLEQFVNTLLPIIDSLELCINSAETVTPITEAMQAMLEGVQLTLKMFYAAMEKFNIQQVNPVSQAFNPDYHQATAVQMDLSLPTGTVLSVLQKGYLLSGRLIRPALVVVSKREESVEKQ